MSADQETLSRFKEARRILGTSAPSRALWFLVGKSAPCFIWKGRMSPMIFEDDSAAALVCEFLAAMGPRFDDYEEASMELLGTPTMRIPDR